MALNITIFLGAIHILCRNLAFIFRRNNKDFESQSLRAKARIHFTSTFCFVRTPDYVQSNDAILIDLQWPVLFDHHQRCCSNCSGSENNRSI